MRWSRNLEREGKGRSLRVGSGRTSRWTARGQGRPFGRQLDEWWGCLGKCSEGHTPRNLDSVSHWEPLATPGQLGAGRKGAAGRAGSQGAGGSS